VLSFARKSGAGSTDAPRYSDGACEFRLDDPKVSTILLDYSTGIHAAVQHLADLGHTRIAFLAGPHKLHSAITRENDFRAAIQDSGLTIQKKWIIECDHTLKGGMVGFSQLQELGTRPTAILCSNDMTAIGVLRAAYMAGCVCRTMYPWWDGRHRLCRVYAAAAHDDSAVAHRFGAIAFDALRQQAEDPNNPKIQREYLVSTSLVVRGSTGRRRLHFRLVEGSQRLTLLKTSSRNFLDSRVHRQSSLASEADIFIRARGVPFHTEHCVATLNEAARNRIQVPRSDGVCQ